MSLGMHEQGFRRGQSTQIDERLSPAIVRSTPCIHCTGEGGRPEKLRCRPCMTTSHYSHLLVEMADKLQ